MNQELVTRWELDSALATSAVIARCALERRESRGGHFRDDYPERSNDFNRHTLAWMETFGEIRLGTRAVDMSIHAEGGPFAEKFAVIERKY